MTREFIDPPRPGMGKSISLRCLEQCTAAVEVYEGQSALRTAATRSELTRRRSVLNDRSIRS